jgi:hypothetical protein
MPICLTEMLRRQFVRDLLQRATQSYEIPIAPHARLHQPPAIEIDEVHQVIANQQDVVRIQIRMTHTQVVKHANATTDDDPPENRDAARPHHRRQRNRIDQPFSDQVRGVSEPTPLIAGRDRRRHWQTGAVKVIKQLPLAKRARFEFTAPQVPIAHEARNQTTASIVPQHQPLGLAGANEMHGAAPARFTIQFAAFLPEGGIEPGRCRVAGPGGVI